MRYLFNCVVILFFLCVTSVTAGESHPFSVHDLVMFDRISEPQVSPDGKMIVFTLRTTDLNANKGLKDLWLVDVDGSHLRQLTTYAANDYNPRWSIDGKMIYFLSSRSGSTQIWRIRLLGGEAEQVTDLPLDVENLILSPDGKHIAFTIEVFPEFDDIKLTANKLTERENSKTTGMIYEKTFVRHWDTWKDGRRMHIFVMPIFGGQVIDLMAGMEADSPSKPFGGTEEFTFTPDGEGIVFTARDGSKGEPWSTDFDLYYVPIAGKQKPACLTEENNAWDTYPAFSPDGKTLAYLAMQRPGFEADRYRLVLYSWHDGAKRVLTENFDRSFTAFTWSPDGKTIFANAENFGQNALFAIDVASSKVTTILSNGTIRSYAFAGSRIVYALDYLQSPVELYSMKADGKDIRQITRMNAEKLAATRMGDFEQFNFKGWNDETVYGYVVKPVDVDPTKKYPVAYLIHGGPQGCFGNDFHYRWNPQVYAGAGYAAVMVDFHGSTGYGQAFSDAIRDDWGGKPLVDLQKGLAAALTQYPWMDGERVGALGASFGGYMINWIAGNWSDRFRCLVSHDGNLDERMAYFDTEELWFPEWEKFGTPWDNPESYEKHNPINYIKNWKTPMLIVHSANDYRVVITQGIASFNALQRKGIASKFLYFPDENHWVQKPHNSIFWHDTVIGWLDQWLKN